MSETWRARGTERPLRPGEEEALRAREREVDDLIRTGRRFLVTSHRQPDGDAAGSALALAALLRVLGKEVVLYLPDGLPYNLAFLPGAAEHRRSLPPDQRFDGTFVTDCARLSRMGADFPPPASRGVLVFFDHHPVRGDPPDIDYNDDTAPSVGELVVRSARRLAAPLTTEIAIPAYVSLLMDTGGFRYGNTTPRAFRAAAEMLEAGIDPWDVARHLYEDQPIARVRLLARALSRLDLSPDGRCAILRVEAADLEETGATTDMLDGLVNHARGIAGVEVGVLLHARDGASEVTLRSAGAIDSGALAAALGGTGQPHAGTCWLPADYDEARRRIFAALEHLRPTR